MMATPLPSGKQRVYLYRLLRLTIDQGTLVVRELLGQAIANVPLHQFLAQEKQTIKRLTANKIITKVQYDVLFPTSGNPPTTADLDLTLVVSLLKNLNACGLNPYFSWNALPLPGDTSLESDVQRMQLFLNELAHIYSTDGIEKIDFNKKWSEIEQVLNRLNGSLQISVPNLQQTIDDCKSKPLDPEVQEQIEKYIENMQSSLMFVDTQVQDIHFSELSENTIALVEQKKVEGSPLQMEIVCEPCSHDDMLVNATTYCVDCSEYLCSICSAVHKRMRITRYHRVIEQEPVSIPTRGDAFNLISLNPGRPLATCTHPDSVTLTWDPSPNIKKGDYYQIAYKDVTNERKWTLTSEEHTSTRVTVSRLKPKTKYVFRVRVVHEDGEEGPYSKESEEIETMSSMASRLIKRCRMYEGNPESPNIIYSLPFTEEARSVRNCTKRLTLGKRFPAEHVESKTILLVGATGTGKSLFVDGIINYALGVTWEDPFRFTIEDLLTSKNEALSQTEWISCYTINPEMGSRINFQLQIIDTPGFGDTRGLERDREIIGQIQHFFSETEPVGLTFIDAVCFLIKAPDARLTTVQSYIFQSIMSLFGKDIENNICSIITFSDGKDPPVLAALRESGLPFGQSFMFNNSCLLARNIDASLGESLNPFFWEMGMRSFTKFFRYLSQLQTKSIQLTNNVLHERNRLEAIFLNLKECLDVGLNIVKILKQEENVIRKNKEKIEENKNFEYEVEETQQAKKPLPEGVFDTNCQKCIFKCHNNCSCKENGDMNMCKVIDVHGFCEVCPGKCHFDKHVSEKFRYDSDVVKVKRTCADMQAKYSEASGKLLSVSEIVEKNEQKLNDIRHNVEELVRLIKRCNQNLQEISLRPNPISETEYIDLLIAEEEMYKKYGYLEKIEILKELRESLDIANKFEMFTKQSKVAESEDRNSKLSVEESFQRIAKRLRNHLPNYKL